MAIFYDHIKGVDNTGSITTYIKFNKQTIENEDNFNFPTINLNSTGDNSYGQIITTGTANHTEEQIIIPNKKLCFGDSSHYIQYNNAYKLQLYATDNSHIYLQDSSVDIKGNTTIIGKVTFNSNISSNIILDAGKNINVGTGGYITAPYFVATSDKRYKEHFKPLPSVLDFITSTSLYTFNYKSSPEDRNIGIIAQDVENYNLDDFNLVLNIKGEKGEFKAVKESKIPYILWKGIQEESGKISRLEEENAALAKKVDKLEKVVEQLIKLTGLEVINETIE